MKPSRLYAVLVTLSMMTVGFVAVTPSAGAQDAPDVQGNCYEGDGDLVAVSVYGQNVHGDHSGGNAVDADVKNDNTRSGDDDDLVDADAGDPGPPIVGSLAPGDSGHSKQTSGSDCDTVDADVGSRSTHGEPYETNEHRDNDTVDADVDSNAITKGGGDAQDDDEVDADVGSMDRYSGETWSDDDTVDADIASRNGDIFSVEDEQTDDDTVDVDIASNDLREEGGAYDGNEYDSDDDVVWVDCDANAEVRFPFLWEDPGVREDHSCDAQYDDDDVPNHP